MKLFNSSAMSVLDFSDNIIRKVKSQNETIETNKKDWFLIFFQWLIFMKQFVVKQKKSLFYFEKNIINKEENIFEDIRYTQDIINQYQ